LRTRFISDFLSEYKKVSGKTRKTGQKQGVEKTQEGEKRQTQG
jgi:hypothetical protein